MRRNRTFRFIAGAGVLALAVGFAPGAAQAAPSNLDVTWGPCADAGDDLPERLVCATLTVPVDWAQPGGATFKLALAKLPAADPGKRIGSLFVNPGGPGGSGVSFVYRAESSFSPELIDQFDFVSFDPRGQARSQPVLCDSDLAVAQDQQSFPSSAAEYERLRRTNRALGESCDRLSGPLARHVDTASVVRDMDAVRAAIGESKISYYGVSYGTMIGQQYAELFPDRIRSLVIDSNMDHSLDIWNYQKWEATAMEGSFLQFAAWCDRTPACALHGENVPAYFDELYAETDSTDLLWTTFGYMYDPADWFDFAQYLKELGGGGRSERRGEPVELGYRPVMCQDFIFDTRPYWGIAAIEGRLAKLAPHTKLNPLAWTDLTGCQSWPGSVTNPPHRLQASPELPPILMTNSRYDIATPYEWGQNLAAQLPSATFVTYDGVGHGDYWLSPCARAAIDTYLVTLRTPPAGTHCPAVFPTTQNNKSKKSLINPLDGQLTR